MQFLTERLRRMLVSFFAGLGSFTLFTQTATAAAFAPPYRRSITRLQMDAIGFGSLPIVTLTGLFMGLVLGLQGIVELKNFGSTAYLGRPIGTTVIRELGPVLSAMMVAARSGSAIAAELASMAITEQIDALRAEGSNPIRKLVEPRLVAATLMMPMLTLICDGMAFIGGWIIAVRDVKITSYFYWDSVMEVLTPAFIWGGVLKSVVFGFIIGAVACYTGMKTGMDSAGVGVATTRSVVLCSILILSLDFILTKILTLLWW